MSVQKFTIREHEINTYQNAKEIQEQIDSLFVAASLLDVKLEFASIDDYFQKQILIRKTTIASSEIIGCIVVSRVDNLLIGFALPEINIYKDIEYHLRFENNEERTYLPDQLLNAIKIMAANL